jgi:gamma-L-glutamyl-butirosin B gamma-L-glutamyl cyclotransferase
VHYFGYGSNLCSEDLARWCRESGLPTFRLARIASGFLPDRRLAFSHRSTTRGGGVLDVPDARGTAVAGVIFRAPDDDAVRALDLKESRGHAHRRIEAIAVTEDGGEHRVFTYEVEPAGRVPFVAPPVGYLDVVRRGYRDHEISLETLEATARGAHDPGPVRSLFVYGTLRKGEERHHVLVRPGASPGEAATVGGTLLDFGDYPGLIVDGPKTAVAGELYPVTDADSLFAELDPIETFHGFGVPGSLYRRAIVRAASPKGAVTLAWTYVYNGSREGVRAIESGDWSRRIRG